MSRRPGVWALMFIPLVLAGGWVVLAQEKPATTAPERKVKEAQVPEAALAALKKLAGSATITQIEEEIEHGHKFYEGSWTAPGGTVDALVTEGGDVVELEETVSADKVPAAVRAAIEKEAGKDAKPTFEKKTMILYEAKFTMGDHRREILLTPWGALYHEEGEGHEGEEDD